MMTDSTEGQAYYRRLAKTYLEKLLMARRQEALDTILTAVDDGTSVRDIYLQVLQPVMYEVGRMWQTDEIDVAVEHYCTAATQLLMSQLFPLGLNTRSNGKVMVGCCLGSELHELGLRMVCDFFDFEGWQTYFIGAQTPVISIIKTIRGKRPDLICLSATLYYGVSQTKELIESLHSAMDDKEPVIFVGGLPYIMNPDLYKRVGAHGAPINAQAAVEMAARMVA